MRLRKLILPILFLAVLICSCEKGPTQVINSPAYISWERFPGPYGGYVYNLAATSKGEFLAGTSSGMFVSHVGGQTWEQYFLHEGSVEMIKQLENGDIYVSTIQVTPSSLSYDLYRSRDDGATWAMLPLVPFSSGITSIEEGNGQILFLATNYAGVYQSKDDAQTWSESYSIVNTNYDEPWLGTVFDLLNPGGGVLLAGTGKGIARSTDNGNSWNDVAVIEDGARYLLRSVKNSIFVSTYSGIYRSRDLGTNWYRVLDQGGGQMVSDSRGRLIFPYGTSLYYSDNDGDTWKQLNSSQYFSTNFVSSSSNILLSTNSQNQIIRSTDDGYSWQESEVGFSGRIVVDLLATQDALLTYVGGSGIDSYASLRTSDFGLHWADMAITNATYAYTMFSRTDNGVIYAALTLVYRGQGDSLAPSEVHRSSDDGITWSTVNTSTIPQLTGFTATAQGTLYGFVLSGTVYRSTDAGNTWEQSNVGFNLGNGIKISANDSGIVVLSGFISTDGGITWSNKGLGTVVNKRGDIFSAGSGCIFRSTDKGVTWKKSTLSASGPGNNEVKSIQFSPTGQIVAGVTNGGIFISSDNGDTWYECNQGLLNTDVVCVSIGEDGYVYVGTNGGGVFRSQVRLH